MHKTIGAAFLSAALVLAACGKKPPPTTENGEDGPPATQTAPADQKPVEGANLEGLSESQKNRFERLVDTLNSPCGKPHSLRTSRNTDKDCARAVFAVDYVIELLKDNGTNKEIRELYERRYRDLESRPRFTFDLAQAPKFGPEEAEIDLVEYYDYGCPACLRFKGALEEAVAELGGKVRLHYKQFPLPGHQPGSGIAAQAALAVHALDTKNAGWFKTMHDWLFANQDKHTREAVQAQAESMGIKAADFSKAFDEAAARVEADRAEGLKDKRVESTPTLFINGRAYDGPQQAKYIKMFVQEAMATSK